MAAEQKKEEEPESESASLFQGKLNKRGKINSSWKERWFVHRENEQVLQYYASKKNARAHKKLCGTIDLSKVHRITTSWFVDVSLIDQLTYKELIVENKETESKTSKPFSFQLVTSERTYVLSADTVNIYILWINELSQAIYGNVLYEKYLLRQENAKTNQWKSRYFTLNKYKRLKCYVDETRHQFLHSTDLNLCQNVSDEAVKDAHLEYTLKLQSSKDESLLIAFPSIEEMAEWEKILNMVRLVRADSNILCDEMVMELVQMNTKQNMPQHAPPQNGLPQESFDDFDDDNEGDDYEEDEFVDNISLELENDQIVYIHTKHTQQIQKCSFVLLSGDEYVDKSKVERADIYFDGHYIYNFDTNDIYFLIPFGKNTQTSTLYIQFEADTDFIKIKSFRLNPLTFANKFDYILTILRHLRYRIEDASDFYAKIGADMSSDTDISALCDNKLVYEFCHCLNKNVCERVFEELGITQLAFKYKILSHKWSNAKFHHNYNYFSLTLGKNEVVHQNTVYKMHHFEGSDQDRIRKELMYDSEVSILFESKPLGCTLYRGLDWKNAWIADLKSYNMGYGKNGMRIGLYVHVVNDLIVDNFKYYDILSIIRQTPAPLVVGFNGYPPLNENDECIQKLLKQGYSFNLLQSAWQELNSNDDENTMTTQSEGFEEKMVEILTKFTEYDEDKNVMDNLSKSMSSFGFEDTLFLRPEWIKNGSFCRIYVKNKEVFGVDHYLELQNVTMSNLQIAEENDDEEKKLVDGGSDSENDEIMQLVKMKSLHDEVKREDDMKKVTNGIASDEFVVDADSESEDVETKGNKEKENDDDEKNDVLEETNEKEINAEMGQSDNEVVGKMQTKQDNNDNDSMYEEPNTPTKGNSVAKTKVCIL